MYWFCYDEVYHELFMLSRSTVSHLGPSLTSSFPRPTSSGCDVRWRLSAWTFVTTLSHWQTLKTFSSGGNVWLRNQLQLTGPSELRQSTRGGLTTTTSSLRGACCLTRYTTTSPWTWTTLVSLTDRVGNLLFPNSPSHFHMWPAGKHYLVLVIYKDSIRCFLSYHGFQVWR